MALVISVSTYGNMLTFRWDNGDCFTFNRTVTVFEHIRITDRSDGVFLEVKIADEPVHRFKFDSKDSAWSAHEVVIFKSKEWSMPTGSMSTGGQGHKAEDEDEDDTSTGYLKKIVLKNLLECMSRSTKRKDLTLTTAMSEPVINIECDETQHLQQNETKPEDVVLLPVVVAN